MGVLGEVTKPRSEEEEDVVKKVASKSRSL